MTFLDAGVPLLDFALITIPPFLRRTGCQYFILPRLCEIPHPLIFPQKLSFRRAICPSLRGTDAETSDFSSHQNVTFLYSDERDLFP